MSYSINDLIYINSDTGDVSFTGNILIPGTITASNINITTITSNNAQVIITNSGTGPALKVTQTGTEPIVEFYDDAGILSFKVANGGLIGIGTNTPRQLLDVQGGDIITTGNIGIGTTIPIHSLHVSRQSYFSGNIGIGTTTPRQLLDIQGGNAIISGNIGIGTTSPLLSLHVVGQSYHSANVGIGTTAPRQLLDVQGGNAIISGNIGIGTTAPRQLLDVQGGDIIATGNIGVGTTIPIHSLHVGRQSYFNGNVGIGTTAPRQLLDVQGGDMVISGNIGIGTTAPRQLLDVQGGNSIFSGNVGIGTTNADYRLVVGDNTTKDEIIKVDSQGFAGLILNGDSANTAGEVGGAYIHLRQDAASVSGILALNQIADKDGKGGTLTNSIANALLLHHVDNYPIQFGTNGTVKMTMVANGNIGIGTTSPAVQLHLSSDGARKLSTTTWATGSDIRIKQDIEDADTSVCYNVVKNLKLKRFAWNSNYYPNVDDRHMLGWIAQDVREILPNAVKLSSEYGFDDFHTLNPDQLYKMTYGAVYEISKENTELKQEIEELKQKYNMIIEILQNKGFLS